MLSDPYELAHDLERRLGNPFGPDAPMSFSRSMALDEAEAFPEESLARLNDWGLHRHAVPAALGGALVSFEHLFALTRGVSRRDLTVAIANGQTFLGCVPVWLGGTEEQRGRLANRVLAGTLAALALTERDHGSDLLATDTVATQTPAGYRLSGEKWLINNGTRAGVLTVLARTRSERGPRSCSVFLVDKARLPGSGWLHLEKVHTLGIRGADISGIRFDGCDLVFDDLVGVPGHGLDLVLKSLQVTRTLCAAFSLGAADTALRTTLRFALSRVLYGGPVFEIPHARRTLVDAFVDVLVCDCVATAAARALHVLTGEMSVWSPIVKYFVPVTVESSLRNLAAILGARHYLRQDHDAGVFQKVLRDNAVVSLFDGSTAVNLAALGAQLPQIARDQRADDGLDMNDREGRLALACSVGTRLPAFDGSALQLHNRGVETVVQSAPWTLERVRAIARDDLESDVRDAIVTLAGHVEADLRAVREGIGSTMGSSGRQDMSAARFDASAAYCRLFAALLCMDVWLGSQSDLGRFFAGGAWLALALNRLARHPVTLPPRLEACVAAELRRRCEEGEMFGIVPVALPA